MQLSFMWMLKYLLLGRETTVARKKDKRFPYFIIHNLTRRRGSSLAIDVSVANPFSQVGVWFKSQTTGSSTQQRDRQDQQAYS